MTHGAAIALGSEVNDLSSTGGRAVLAHELVHRPAVPLHDAAEPEEERVGRGRALGLVMSLPAGDRYYKHKSKMKAELAMAMGGRVAEEIVFGSDKVSNGASGDIKMATNLARMMVTEWGMSDRLGMVAYGDNSQEVFLGHSVTQTKNVSEETARLIDAEIRGIIDGAYARAKQILTDNREQLDRISKILAQRAWTGMGVLAAVETRYRTRVAISVRFLSVLSRMVWMAPSMLPSWS